MKGRVNAYAKSLCINRMPPDDDPKAGYRLRAERRGEEWILDGEKCFVANGSVARLFFVNTRTITEALRSFVMRVAAEADAKAGHYAGNAIFLQNFATDVVQRVTALNLDIHGGAGVAAMDAGAEKLARDAVIWTHLAGDTVQRIKAVRAH